MTITNPEAFMDGIWDWAILQGCFGDSKINPADLLVDYNIPQKSVKQKPIET